MLLCARLYIPKIAITISPILLWSSCNVTLTLCPLRAEICSWPLNMHGLMIWKKVPLYDFQNKTIKGDTTASWDFWDAYSWNRVIMLWENPTTTWSRHVQLFLPMATFWIPSSPGHVKEDTNNSSLQVTLKPWGPSREAFRHHGTLWNRNNLYLLCLLQIPDPQNLECNVTILLCH